MLRCSWLVAIDVLVLLDAAPPLHVDVFGSEPGVSAQGALSQTQRQQPGQQRHRSSLLMTGGSRCCGWKIKEA